MRRESATPAAIAALFLFRAGAALAQGCCGAAGFQRGAFESGAAPPGKLDFGIDYELTVMETYLRGTRVVADPFDRRGVSQFVNLNLSYGFSQRLSGSVVVPFVQKEMDFTGGRNFGSGPGDVTALIKFDLLASPAFSPSDLDFAPVPSPRTRQLAVGLGLKFPTGDYHQEVDGVRQSLAVQPGTGSLDGIIWGYYSDDRPGLSFFANVTFRVKGENTDAYRPGNDLLYETGLAWRRLEGAGWSVSLRGRSSGTDESSGMEMSGTGGDWIYLVPRVSWSRSPKLSLDLGARVPVYARVNGTQLSATYGLDVGLFLSF